MQDHPLQEGGREGGKEWDWGPIVLANEHSTHCAGKGLHRNEKRELSPLTEGGGATPHHICGAICGAYQAFLSSLPPSLPPSLLTCLNTDVTPWRNNAHASSMLTCCCACCWCCCGSCCCCCCCIALVQGYLLEAPPICVLECVVCRKKGDDKSHSPM